VNYSPFEIAEKIGAEVLQQGEDVSIQYVFTDSRTVFQGARGLFVPLITSLRNAHVYLEDVYKKGVRCFIVGEDVPLDKLSAAWVLRVDDTLKALQIFARLHRESFNFPIVGITGSNGKTIIKEWLNQILGHKERIVRSPKSYNSKIGVPLSIFLMNEKHSLGLFEAGISEVNEMDILSDMLQADIGIITNLSEAHNEGFSSMQQKANEKVKLFKACKKIIYCSDYPEIVEALRGHSGELVAWSQKNEAVLQVRKIDRQLHSSIVHLNWRSKDIKFTIPFSDEAYTENAISTFLLCLELGCEVDELIKSFAFLSSVPMRLELKKGINQSILINDSYSSDLSSLRIALDYLYQQENFTKKSLILSDILQHWEGEATLEVIKLLAAKPLSSFIAIGEQFAKYKDEIEQIPNMQSYFYSNTTSFIQEFDFDQIQQEAILVKGARKFAFEKIVNRLEENIHQTVLQINLPALINNINTYKRRLAPETKLMAMVKAFSYGSGTYEIANVLQHHGLDYLAVAYTDEGIELRKNGVQLPIMVLNPDPHTLEALLHYNLEPEIYSPVQFDAILQSLGQNQALNIHLKLDTGMHRLGFEMKDLESLLQILTTDSRIKVLSVFSHLVGSENSGLDDFTVKQNECFVEMNEIIQGALAYDYMRHLCNSSAIIRHPNLQYDMVRLGLGLYGVDSSAEIQHELLNVSTLKTTISQIKEVKAGETVGYSRKGKLDRDSRIGTIGIGYADGYSRSFGNGIGKVLIGSSLAKVVGNVCMDMCMIDLTDVPNVKEGDEVIIFGDKLSLAEISSWIDTISYEIVSGISQRVKRVYFQE